MACFAMVCFVIIYMLIYLGQNLDALHIAVFTVGTFIYLSFC